MAGLPFKTKDEFVKDAVTRWAAELGLDPNLQSGSSMKAWSEALGLNLTYMQLLVSLVNDISRAGTSRDGDLDTWVNDFGFSRLPAQKAIGDATFGVISPKSTQTLISAGSIIQTADGLISYEVVADTTNPAWSPDKNAYILPASTSTVVARVQALLAGAGSNVQANTLTKFYSVVAGIDTVTNLNPITNGADSESDVAVRARFILWFANRQGGTLGALLAAALGVKQNLDVELVENFMLNGTPQTGFVSIVVDDGTGSPPSSLLAQIFAACDVVRAAGIQIAVGAPTSLLTTLNLSVKVKPGVDATTIQAKVQSALIAYVNTLPIGATLYLHKLTEIAIDSDPNVITVQPGSVLINSSAIDLAATKFQIIRTDLAHCTIGTY